MAKLASSTIKFRTGEKDKNADTRVTVIVRDRHNEVAARVSDEFGRFRDGSDNGPFDLSVEHQTDKEDLRRGNVTIRIDPPEDDKWSFTFFLDLKFDDGSHLSGGAGAFRLTTTHPDQTLGLSGIIDGNDDD
jgi:hypothetical protein